MIRLHRLLPLAIVVAAFVSSPSKAAEAAVPVPGAENVLDDSTSYSMWAIDGKVVRLQVTLPMSEADKLAGPGEPAPDASAVSEAVAASFAARSSTGPCSVVDQGEGEGQIYRLALTPRIYKFEMIFLCGSGSKIAISDNLLFDRVPRHIDFARVQAGSRPAFANMFDAAHRTYSIEEAQGSGGSSLAAFARAGAANLVAHAELLCILVAISLFCGERRDLAFVAGGVVVGQAFAVGLSMAGLVLEWPSLTGALVGLLVSALGAAALRFRSADRPAARRGWRIAAGIAVTFAVGGAILLAGRSGISAGAATAGFCVLGLAMLWGAQSVARPHWLVWFPSILFGLVSGMSIASDLAILSLPSANILAPLTGWMVGITLVASLFACLFVIAFFLLGRRSQAGRQAAFEIASAGLIGLGFFWFVGRL